MNKLEWFQLFVAVVMTAMLMWWFYGVIVLIARGLRGIL